MVTHCAQLDIVHITRLYPRCNQPRDVQKLRNQVSRMPFKADDR